MFAAFSEFDTAQFITMLFGLVFGIIGGIVGTEYRLWRERQGERKVLQENERVKGLLDKISLMKPEGVDLRNKGMQSVSETQLPDRWLSGDHQS